MLIHNNNLSLYAGVSKQALDLRLPSHCEEMINCYPSVELGLRRRNPTQLISGSMNIEDNQFVHTYDRGLAGDAEEQYVITIDSTNGLKVFDVTAREYVSVTYTDSALNYIANSNPQIGFSAITIKDTTIIVNKEIVPLMVGEYSGSVNYAALTIGTTGYSLSGLESIVNPTVPFVSTKIRLKTYDSLAPARIKNLTFTSISEPTLSFNAFSALGATTTVVIDGTITVKYTTGVIFDTWSAYPESMASWITNITSAIRSAIGSGYKTYVGSDGKIYIYDLSGSSISVTSSTSFPVDVVSNPPAYGKISGYNISIAQTNYGSAPISVAYSSTTHLLNYNTSTYDKEAFIWVKQVSVDTAFPYTFYVTLKETNGTVIASTSSSATSATGVASAFASWANGLADFTASSSGSVCKITRDSGTQFLIDVSDTYGSQASSCWKGAINQMEDLPKSFPYTNTIVRIDGVNSIDNIKYWVKYDGNQWVEHRDPAMLNKLETSTMPHKLTRNANFTFTLSPIVWEDITVGDKDTQAIPEFIGNAIQDLFFVNGRLGILTANGISLSETNNVYNFFRTTVLELLDTSPVTTYIDSSKAVGLKFASELQGAVVLFGDKAQFALDASKPISPKSISVQPISGFEINRNVKPVSSGDSVFFLVSKNGYSSLMEMNKTTISASIKASDVSAHVPTYIDYDIMQIVSSSRDNAIFLRSRENKNTIYMYKHFGDTENKVQMSWSKWTFGINISSVFVFNKELYIVGNRYDASIPVDEFSLSQYWDDSNVWFDETYYAESGVPISPTFEKIDIEPYGVNGVFKDNGGIRYDSEVVLSEWKLSAKEAKEIRGNLLIKTVEISSEDGSDFYLVSTNNERNKERTIPSIYTVNRKPFIGGNAKNMEIKIASVNGAGFQINSISTEGQYNVRSRNTK